MNAAFLALAVVVVVASALIAYSHPPTTSSDWAAWMQGIGTVIAVIVAIWVPSKQTKNARDDDATDKKKEVSAMVESMRQEFEIALALYDSAIGDGLKGVRKGVGYPLMFPIADQPFPIYRACAGQIGRIPCVVVRRTVVEAYSRCMGLALTFRKNNELITDVLSATKELGLAKAGIPSPNILGGNVVQVAEGELKLRVDIHNDYGGALRGADQAARKAIRDFDEAVVSARQRGALFEG